MPALPFALCRGVLCTPAVPCRGELRSPARCFLCLHFRLRSVGACFARPPSPVGASRTRQRNGHRSFPTPAIDGYSMRATTGRPYTLRITPSPVGASCARPPSPVGVCFACPRNDHRSFPTTRNQSTSHAGDHRSPLQPVAGTGPAHIRGANTWRISLPSLAQKPTLQSLRVISWQVTRVCKKSSLTCCTARDPYIHTPHSKCRYRLR